MILCAFELDIHSHVVAAFGQTRSFRYGQAGHIGGSMSEGDLFRFGFGCDGL